MLQRLFIKNFILISQINIELKDGLTVISGETGAGKSIILDALKLLLNKKNAKLVKKHQNENSIIEAVLKKNQYIEEILIDNFIDNSEDFIILKKVVNKNNKVLAYINDQNVTVKVFSEVANSLIEMHGQHDNNDLFNKKNHRIYLDEQLDKVDKTSLTQLANLYQEYKTQKKYYNDLKQQQNILQEQLTYNQNIVNDLKDFLPKQDDYQNLQEQKLKLKKIFQNKELYRKFASYFCDSQGIEAKLLLVQKELINNLAGNEAHFSIILNQIETMLSCCDKVNESLFIEDNNIENNLEDVTDRISDYKKLGRKYKVNELALEELYNNAINDIEVISRKVNLCNELDGVLLDLKSRFLDKCQLINQARLLKAKKLEDSIHNVLADLYMEKTKFNIKFTELVEHSWNENGNQEIIFTVSTNPGQPFGELSKIASGGELSRFMLALKTALISHDKTLIFDEIDVGISGKVADSVGKRLKKLSSNNQIIIITHLVQVASKSDHHIGVIKYYDHNNTEIKVKSLSLDEKTNEIARMISGKVVTDEAIITAKQIIANN